MPAPGERLGPFEILDPLGAGGMGEVWKARDSRLDRIVALKISKDQFSERFDREARAVAALNHPHICQLYDVGPNYLVMEYIEGVPLKGTLPVEKAVEYAGQILEALDAAHRNGVTHRDLKPANILVTKQGIKLLDFGLAKAALPAPTYRRHPHRSPHHQRRDRRHPAIHVARATPGQRHRRPHRPLLLRLRALRNADG